MKKTLLSSFMLLFAIAAMAQQKLAFPFQGGNQVMSKFFRDSLKVSDDITKARATGTAVLKFTADEQGAVKKIIVYYADDALLIQPIIEALKKTDRKWIIPDHEKLHDFILPLSINFIVPETGADKVAGESLAYYKNRRPIVAFDQVPLDMATLLPTIVINYKLQ